MATPDDKSTPHPPDSPGSCDVTLIDAMLALTPEERLRLNDRMVQAIQELRHGFAAVLEETLRRQGQGKP